MTTRLASSRTRIAIIVALAALLVSCAALLATPQQAFAAQKPSESEVYVNFTSMADNTDKRLEYDAATGTLTLHQYSGYGPIEVRASSPRDLIVVADGYCSVYTYSKTPGVTTDVYGIVNMTGGTLTIKATQGKQFVIKANMTEVNNAIQNIAAIRCAGEVTLTGVDESWFSVRAVNTEVVDGHSTGGTNAPVYGIWAEGGLNITGSTTGKNSNTIEAKNSCSTVTAENPSAAIRVGNGKWVNLWATGKWDFDTRYNDGVAATIFCPGDGRPNFTIKNVSQLTCGYGVAEHPDTDFFILNGSGIAWTPSQWEQYTTGYMADLFWNGVKFKPDSRTLITSTTIKLNEVPPLGTYASIVDNCVVDSGYSTPRYTLLSVSGFRYKKGDSDIWHGLGSNGSIPEDATHLCAYLKLQANDNYRLSYSTALDVVLPNGNHKEVTDVDTNTSAGNPAGTPSVGMYYVELDLTTDLPDSYPIESVEIAKLYQTPQAGRAAKVYTKASSTYIAVFALSESERHCTFADDDALGIEPGYAYWEDLGVPGTGATPVVLTADDTFLPGHQYRLNIFLYSKAGWQFPANASECSVYIEGRPALITTHINGDPRLAVVTRTWTLPSTVINSVAVDGLTEPVVGAMAVADGTVEDGVPYSIATTAPIGTNLPTQYWYEGDGSLSMTPFTGSFQANNWYTYVVFLEPDRANGYKFQGNNGSLTFPGTINGESYSSASLYKTGDSDPGTVMMRRKFFVPDANAVERIDISQTMPVVGAQSVADSASLTDDVTLTSSFDFDEDYVIPDHGTIPAHAPALWMYGTLFSTDYYVMPVFEAGKTYNYSATAVVADGVFDVGAAGNTSNPDVKVFVDGIPAKVTLSADYKTANISLKYTVPAAGLHCLYVPTGVGLSVDNGDGYHITKPLEENVNIDGTGYDLHFIQDGARVTLAIWNYGATWKAPEGEQFYKWVVSKGNPTFDSTTATHTQIGMTMPEEDVVIDILTAPTGTVPKTLTWSMMDHKEHNWSEDSDYYTTYNGTQKLIWYVIIDDMGTSDTSDDYTLQRGIDYSITYKDEAGNVLAYTDESGEFVYVGDGPVNAGQVNVTYECIPRPGTTDPGYDGTRSDYFTIQPADIRDCTVIVDCTFTDDSVSPAVPYEYFTGQEVEPTVNVISPDGSYELIRGVDYEVSYGNNINASTETNLAEVRVSGAGGNWAAYYWQYANFEIRPRAIYDEGITWNVPVKEFTGGPVQLQYDLSGSYNGYTLYTGYDYTIESYGNNVFPGDALVTIKGNESFGFTGTTTIPFNIAIDLDSALIDYTGVEAEYAYSAFSGPVEPKPVVTIYAGEEYGNKVLEEGVDYDLIYAGNDVIGGTATVTVVPHDTVHYTGSHEIQFDIIAPPVPVKTDGTKYRIVSASDSDFILDVAEVNPTAGANVSIWTSNGGLNQLFTFEYAPDGNIVMRNVANDDLVLDAAGAEPEVGANISTWTYNKGLNQEWVIVPASEGFYTIASAVNSEFVLDAAGAVPEIGANVSLWYSNGGLNQQWRFVEANDLAYAEVDVFGMERNYTGSALSPDIAVSLNGEELVAGTDYVVLLDGAEGAPFAAGTYDVAIQGVGDYSGYVELGTFAIYDVPEAAAGVQYHLASGFSDAFVLDVAEVMPTIGANVSIWEDNGGDNQLFTMELLGDGFYVLRNVANPELVLDAAGAEPEVGANVSTWSFNDGLNQKWVLIPSDKLSGYYRIASVSNTTFVLDAAGAEPEIGANVSIWIDNDGLNQLWKPVAVS